MRGKNYFYAGIGVFVLIIIGMFSVGLLSTGDASGVISPSTNWDCGIYQQSYNKDYINTFMTECHDQGFSCYRMQNEGTYGTIYNSYCDQPCYECVGTQTKTYQFTDGCYHASISSGNVYNPIPKNYLTDFQQDYGTQAVMRYDYDDNQVKALCSKQITCYQCDGTSVKSRIFENTCDSGWTENKPSCGTQHTSVTCYQCDGTSVESKSFDDYCPSGWSLNRPSCESTNTMVTCYQCNGPSEISTTFKDTCPIDWKPYHQECKKQITCYSCEGNELKSQQILSDSCPSGWSETQLTCTQPKNLCYSCINGVKTSMEFTKECKDVNGEWSSTPIESCSTPLVDLKSNGPYIIIGGVLGTTLIIIGLLKKKKDEF